MLPATCQRTYKPSCTVSEFAIYPQARRSWLVSLGRWQDMTGKGAEHASLRCQILVESMQPEKLKRLAAKRHFMDDRQRSDDIAE